MTRQIVHFYETLEEILSQDLKDKLKYSKKYGAVDNFNKDSNVELSYKPACKELNELQEAFNKFAKTINI